jgi:molybdopterin-containing oxidoreductase family membrane subunit
MFYPMFVFNAVVPLLFFFKKFRTDEKLIVACSCLIVVGMWLERYVIIISSLSRDFIPHAWGSYYPSFVESAIMFGTFCFFSLLFLLFVRFIPPVSINELKEHALPPMREGLHG